MDEGRILIAKEYPGSNRFRVNSDCGTGQMRYVGVVWPERDWSAAAKRRKVPSHLWMARHAGQGSEVGPFSTRKAAAEALSK